MIRILQAVNIMDRAGLETMLMNYYRQIDREKIQFDFLTHRPNEGDYDAEIQKLGGKIYHAPRLYPQNYIPYFAYMKQFFKQHREYRVVHSHIDAMSAFPLAAAKKAGVPVRIAHSHSSSMDRDFRLPIKEFAKMRLRGVATDFLACGDTAAHFLFGKRILSSNQYHVMKNAIEASDFSFCEETREKTRRELHLTDQFTVGHVGRFTAVKNHEFLLQIFTQIKKIHSDSVLLFVGTGEKEEEIREKVRCSHLDSSVRFLGTRSDVPELLQAMDAFVLPSHYEGLPVVGVEAQAADLPCFFSDAVSKEVQILNRCRFISLSCSPEKWAEEILSSRQYDRQSRVTEFINSGFDIHEQAKNLQNFYLNRNQGIVI